MTQPPGQAGESDLYGPGSPFVKLPELTPAGAIVRQLVAYAACGLLVTGQAFFRQGGLPPLGLRLTLADLGWRAA